MKPKVDIVAASQLASWARADFLTQARQAGPGATGSPTVGTWAETMVVLKEVARMRRAEAEATMLEERISLFFWGLLIGLGGRRGGCWM